MRNRAEQQILDKFGRHIAQLRNQKSLSQEQLAARSGLDRMTIAFVETGQRWPRVTTLTRLAKGLDVELAELFRGL
jgi:transcriptional regulator with XRE-family HTH domain